MLFWNVQSDIALEDEEEREDVDERTGDGEAELPYCCIGGRELREDIATIQVQFCTSELSRGHTPCVCDQGINQPIMRGR